MKKRVDLGEDCLIICDMNTAINPCASVSTRAAKNIYIDTKREWEPATSVPTGKGCGPDKVCVGSKPSDHKAQEVVLELDIVETGCTGNKAIISYNNPEGWTNYRK